MPARTRTLIVELPAETTDEPATGRSHPDLARDDLADIIDQAVHDRAWRYHDDTGTYRLHPRELTVWPSRDRYVAEQVISGVVGRATERQPTGWKAEVVATIAGRTWTTACNHNHRTLDTAQRCADDTTASLTDPDT